jgi:PPP family 3-phenylpropionic acid transporter
MSLKTAALAAPRDFALRMRIFYGSYFLFGGVVLPFFPIWLQSRGMTAVEIANIIAIPSLVRVFLTPVAGVYADRAPSRRFAAISFTLPAAIVFLLAWPVMGFWPILLLTGLAFTAYSLALPPAEALALTGVRRFGFDYGRMRLTGSIAFIAANLGSGALLGLLNGNPEAIFWFILAALVAAAAGSFVLPVTPPEIRALDDAVKPDTRPSWAVLGNAGFLLLMLAAGLIQASHAVLYSFGSIQWRVEGYSDIQIGAFWAIGIVCEVAVFMWSTVALKRVGAYGLVIIGAVAAIVRWTAFPFEPTFLLAFVMQSLHGLTFGATYVGTQHLIARLVPEKLTASAQGIFAMMGGILMAAATSVAGPIYNSYGVDGFLFMVPVAVAGLLILLGIHRYARS